MDLAGLRALFAEIGPLRDFDRVLEHDDSAWEVVVDEIEVTAEYDAARAILVLTGDAGDPAAEARARVADALLQYNYAWRESGGVRMALDGPDGAVVQILDLAVDGLDAERLAEAVAAFAALLRDWRELIAGGLADAPATPGPDSMLRPGAIRA